MLDVDPRAPVLLLNNYNFPVAAAFVVQTWVINPDWLGFDDLQKTFFIHVF